MIKQSRRIWQGVGIVLFISLVFIGILQLSSYILDSTEAQALVQQYGYLGVLVIAIIGGLNFVVPIPAPTFTPIFLAGGLSLPWIIMWLVIGTTIADLIGFFFGKLGKLYVTKQYPKTYARLASLRENKVRYIPWFVLGYAAFIPFPNEAFLIPLGILGIRLRTFILPLIVGTTIHQGLLAIGVSNIFTYFLAVT